jgi:CHASE3 domain sensor protein
VRENQHMEDHHLCAWRAASVATRDDEQAVSNTCEYRLKQQRREQSAVARIRAQQGSAVESTVREHSETIVREHSERVQERAV